MTKNILITGASGSFGSNAVTAFEAAGWTVHRYNRKTESLAKAAQGKDVILNAMNPPGYKNWATEIPRITQEVINAARTSGATIIVPGNVYNFGIQPGPWSEDTPQVPNSHKGQIRAEMEAQYRAASTSGVQTIILRGGDFIDLKASGNFFDTAISKDAAKGKTCYPGEPTIPHAFAYLPDMARAAAMLADIRDDLQAFEDVPFEGFTLTGNQIREVLGHLTGKPQKLVSFPWWAIRLGAPFITMWKELIEMRYLWKHPHQLNGAKLQRLLPSFKATPLEEALARALELKINPNKPMV